MIGIDSIHIVKRSSNQLSSRAALLGFFEVGCRWASLGKCAAIGGSSQPRTRFVIRVQLAVCNRDSNRAARRWMPRATTRCQDAIRFPELRIVANLHGIGAVLWQTLRMTHPVQLRRNPLVLPCRKRAGPCRPTEGSSASSFHTVAMT